MITITIPAIGPSANNLFGRMHPMKRKRLVDDWHRLMGFILKKHRVQPYRLGYPAKITCTCFFPKGSKRTDPDNVFATAKLTIDSLVRKRIIENDSPVYIRSVELSSRRSETKNPYTILTIEPAEGMVPNKEHQP